MFHLLAQPSQENLCLHRKDPCSHMCLVTSDLKTKCFCPRNSQMKDENTCQISTKESNNSRTSNNYNDDQNSEIKFEILIAIISASIITFLIISVVS